MAPETAQNTVVKRTLHVQVPIEKAFQIFAERMGKWWPGSHLGGTPFKDILTERKNSGAGTK